MLYSGIGISIPRLFITATTVATATATYTLAPLTLRSRLRGLPVKFTRNSNSINQRQVIFNNYRSYTTNTSTTNGKHPPSSTSTSSKMPLSENDRDTRNLTPSEKNEVHKNRLNRPPYIPPPSSSSSSTSKQIFYSGSCFCSTVKFHIYRERPLDAKYCHCRGCQVMHGAPFQWAAIFEKTDVYFYEGGDSLEFWNSREMSQEYIVPCKVYCGKCRAPIMDEGRNMILLFPTLVEFGSVEEREKFRPSCHIFYSRRSIDVPDGIPKWDEHKDESKLIPETLPPENKSIQINDEGKLL